MKKLLPALAFAVALTACGPQETPNNGRIETGALGIVDVEFPKTISPSEPLNIAIRYSQACSQSKGQITRVSRTGEQLRLSATAEYYRQDPPLICPPVYIEKTIEYADPGTPARTGPFEIVVNGKSYGTVVIQ